MRASGYAEVVSGAAAVAAMGDGTYRRSLHGAKASLYARRVIAIAWLLCRLERAGVVRGVSVCTFLRMIRDVNDGDVYCPDCGHHHPHRSRWNNHHPDATLPHGPTVVYILALELAGAVQRHQWRTEGQIKQHCEPWEIGDSGYPTNEYYLVGRDHVGHVDDRDLTPALIVEYARLRDVAADAVDETLPFCSRRTGGFPAPRPAARRRAAVAQHTGALRSGDAAHGRVRLSS
jgi:hypothetical protein